jgi:hypothetical protein
VPGGQLPVPAQQGRWGDEERRPPRAGQQPRQGGQHHSVGRLQVGAVHLPAEHRHLVAQDKYLDILGPAFTGDLGQHLQDLPKQQVHQGSARLPIPQRNGAR